MSRLVNVMVNGRFPRWLQSYISYVWSPSKYFSKYEILEWASSDGIELETRPSYLFSLIIQQWKYTPFEDDMLEHVKPRLIRGLTMYILELDDERIPYRQDFLRLVYRKEVKLYSEDRETFNNLLLRHSLLREYYSFSRYILEKKLSSGYNNIMVYLANVSLTLLLFRCTYNLDWSPNIHALSTTPKEQQMVLTLVCVRDYAENTAFVHISNELLYSILSHSLRIDSSS